MNILAVSCMDEVFCNIEELREMHRRWGAPPVVVWGTGKVGREAVRTLHCYGLAVAAFASNEAVSGRTIAGIPVVGLADVLAMGQPLVVIGSYVVRPILEQLRAAGLARVHALLDTIKYPPEFWEREAQLPLPTSFSDRVLVELYGNLGDVFLKLGIVRRILERFGEERVWLLAESEDICDALRLVTPQVLCLDEERFAQDASYHFACLRRLNGLRFGRAILLADARLCATRRLLNAHNFRAGATLVDRTLPDREYLPELAWRFFADRLQLDRIAGYSPQGVLDEALKRVELRRTLPARFVAVNMGATKDVRHYPPQQFVPVVRFLLASGWPVVFLGAGAYDRAFFAAIIEALDAEERRRVTSCIDALRVPQALAVLQRSSFFVGTDSGMWHGAYLCGTPSVVIFGGGEPGCFQHPDGRTYYAMCEERSCWGCRWFCTHRTAEGYAACIAGVRPDRIVDGCRTFLEKLETEA